MILNRYGYCYSGNIDNKTLQQFEKKIELPPIYPSYSERYYNLKLYYVISNKECKKNITVFSRNSKIHNYLQCEIHNKLNYNSNINFTLSYNLNNEQISVYDKIINILSCNNICYFQLQTGAGKTFILGKIIEYFKCTTLIVGPNRNTERAWNKMLSYNTSNTTMGNYKLNNIFDITYVTINYLLSNTSIINNIKLLILDEVHNYCTHARLKIFNECNAYYMVGCTATPNRQDNMDKCLEYYLGSLYDFNNMISIKYKTIVNIIKFNSRKQFDNCLTDIHQVYKALEYNNERNRLILSIIKNTSNNTFIFTEHISHIDILYDMINELNDVVVIKYNNKNSDLRLTEEKKTIILTTYKMASESLSLNNFYIIIFGTPRKNNIPQILGRIFRGNTLEQERYIYDIVDINYKFFIKQFNIRKGYYSNNNYILKFE